MKRIHLFSFAIAMSFSLLIAEPAAAATTFKDVKKGSSHYDGVTWLAEQGINGYEDGTFKPYEELSREHAAVMFTEALDLKLPSSSYASDYFDDIEASDPYAREIGAVAKAGIFTGNNGEFKPDQSLTREQMATTLVQALNLKPKGSQAAINLQGVSKTHRSSVQILADLGITVATDNFRPVDTTTRGHFATFLYRSVEGPFEDETPSVKVVKKNYNYSFKSMVNKQMAVGPQTSNGSSWVNASDKLTAYYLNPNNFKQGSEGFYQFLKLSGSSGVSAKELNAKLLKSKGVLSGQGNAFKQGSKKYNVNDVYLISHALLESGNGTSKLARGIEVGKDKNGKPVQVTSKNRKSLKNIKTTYNMYGIGAIDSCPDKCGAERAYKEGWFTPEKAIVGGAEFIGESYIAKGQDTLYKMRWNPANPATHQYATDAGWAVKQTKRIKAMYDDLNGTALKFEVPVYKSQPKNSPMPKGNAKYKMKKGARMKVQTFDLGPEQDTEKVSPDIIVEQHEIRLPE